MAITAMAVFCGSSTGENPAYAQAAEAVGRGLAERGITVVYGGGSVGLMRRVADAALAAGGRVHGVITRELSDREIAHEGLTTLDVVETMAQRKARMSQLADAFLALPGGSGTLEEIVEQWTWSQIGLHRKPCAFLNVEGFYDSLREFVRHAQSEGFIRAQYADSLLFADSLDRVLSHAQHFHAPQQKWARSGDARDQVLRIAALVLNDEQGRTLLVRKRGTTGFMQCGGKLEPGETPLQAVVREVEEELGLRLDPTALEHLGRFDAVALNEADTHVDADAYFARISAKASEMLAPHREIAEVIWADPGRPGVEVAPLSTDDLLPIAAERAMHHRATWTRRGTPETIR